MVTFSDKPIFNLKQLATAITVAAAVGGGIARFEFKTSAIESKLDTMIALIDTSEVRVNHKFIEVDRRLLANKDDIKAITTSLTALLKPDDIEIKQHR